jgi:hypothetical protein
MELFDFKDHYSYLIYRFKTTHRKRGSKLAFSKYLNIQQAFLSQVLKKQYALNLEHADLANYFFGHSSEEADFFLLLVNNDRSGTDSLKKYFQEKINIALKNRLLVIERIGKKHMLSGEEQGIYYSSWLYAAVHIACTISQFQTLHSLSSY